jgi:hypothetical protein
MRYDLMIRYGALVGVFTCCIYVGETTLEMLDTSGNALRPLLLECFAKFNPMELYIPNE